MANNEKLTKLKIDNFKHDESKNLWDVHWDSEVKGFGVRVLPSGKKTYILRYRNSHNRRHIITICDVGSKTLQEARKLATKKLSDIIDGKDPILERGQDKNAKTFKEWAEEYLKVVDSKKKNSKADHRFLALAIKHFGNRPIKEVTSNDIFKIRNEIEFKGKRTSANRFLASVKTCFQEAWRLNLVRENPALSVKMLPENNARTRILTDEEISRLISAIEELPNVFNRAAFYIMLDTGCRLSEVLNCKWADINIEKSLWTIPSTKSGKPQTQILPMGAIEILKTLPRNGEYVIAGEEPSKPRYDLKASWERIQKEADLKDVHIHDLRRTYIKRVCDEYGLRIAQTLARHSDIRVTARHYTPTSDSQTREAVENMPNLIRFTPRFEDGHGETTDKKQNTK